MTEVDVNDSQAVLKAGYKLLTEGLGSKGFVKFMELVTLSEGDYTKEKYEKPDEFIPWEQLEAEWRNTSLKSKICLNDKIN